MKFSFTLKDIAGQIIDNNNYLPFPLFVLIFYDVIFI